MQLRASFVLVAGMCLGLYLACSRLINTAVPVRPFGTNSLQSIVFDGRWMFEPNQTAKLEKGVLFAANEYIDMGNQLFGYACSYALARDRKLPLLNLVPNSSSLSPRKFFPNEHVFILDTFQVPLTNVIHQGSIDTSAVTYINDSQLFFRTYPTDKTLLQIDGICIGYYGYWAQYKKDIIAMFQLRPEVVQGFSPHVIKLGKDIENAEESVAVHVRRGDFGGDLPISFQRDSISKMSNMFAERRNTSFSLGPTFYIFSDDIEYCKRELSKLTEAHDLVFVSSSGRGSRTTSLEDFYLMMKCKHFIITNSSFSWWAAFLGTHKDNSFQGSSSNYGSIVIAAAQGPGYLKKMYGGDTEKLNFYRKVIYGFALFPDKWIVYTPADYSDYRLS